MPTCHNTYSLGSLGFPESQKEGQLLLPPPPKLPRLRMHGLRLEEERSQGEPTLINSTVNDLTTCICVCLETGLASACPNVVPSGGEGRLRVTGMLSF